jgi:hypothetical protein
MKVELLEKVVGSVRALLFLTAVLTTACSGSSEKTCTGAGQAWHYTAPGCGANAPAPMCGGAGMDACFAGYYCGCDGVVRGNCDGWSSAPFAYYVGGIQGLEVDATKPCDPSHPRVADGGAPDANDLSRDGTVLPADAPTTVDAPDASPASDAPLDRALDLPADTADGASCTEPGRAWHYTAAGCGVNAPPPMCGGDSQDACLRGFFCTCDGVLVGDCDGWASKPWAWFVRLSAETYNSGGQSCDPTHPPAPDAG